MDTLSHGLWALAIFWGVSWRWWAFLFGMLPDLLSFGIYLPTRIVQHGFKLSRPPLETTPDWVYAAYGVTHSFITWIIVGIGIYLLAKRYGWDRKVALIVFAPMSHIALDIPTHCSYFPTPFLEPLSSYRYCGMSWGTPWIFKLNWMCLAIVFALIIVHEQQKRFAKRRANTLGQIACENATPAKGASGQNPTRKKASRRQSQGKVKKR